MSIDEVSLSQGELYTFVTNKEGRGKRGSLVASIKGTRANAIVYVLDKIPIESRKTVREVTLDMAKNMESAVKRSFPCSKLVTDRFHVVKLVIDALQHVRVKLRWQELDIENDKIKKSKKESVKYIPTILENGDTPKQLLARCRYILAKKKSNWTESQKFRAYILFQEYPILKRAYNHTMELRNIYEQQSKSDAKEQISNWIRNSMSLEIKEFHIASNSIQYHIDHILNFFNNRSTNANAESFNAKIKLFRSNLRGVADTTFFLFRLYKLFA